MFLASSLSCFITILTTFCYFFFSFFFLLSSSLVVLPKVRTQYRGADVVMFVFDVTRPGTLEQLLPYIADAKVGRLDH